LIGSVDSKSIIRNKYFERGSHLQTAILTCKNPAAVQEYCQKKFEGYNSWYYPESVRNEKCIQYYLAASEENRKYVKMAYRQVFRVAFPEQVANRTQKALEDEPKVESSLWREKAEGKVACADGTLAQLQMWKKDQDYQLGQDFFLRMQTLIAEFDPRLCDPKGFKAESEARRVAELTGKTTKTAKDVGAEFDAMLGYKQRAGITFKARDEDWGQIKLKLEEEFRAGIWGSGSAKAAMTRLGVSAEVMVEIVLGAQLELSGDCTWKKGNYGLNLQGGCHLFAGARANFVASLSAKAREGLNASISAGAFAGFEASVSGSCAFQYGGEDMARVEATAGITFGAGATFEASIGCSIFGPTEITFGGSLTLGMGSSTSVTTSINFSGIYLAGRAEFTRLIYLPTILKGYSPELMTQDRKNLHYLEKCLTRVEKDKQSLIEAMEGYDKTPEESRSLLRKMDL
jgi:hypothetical protein